MGTEIIVGIIGFISTVLSAWTSHFFTRRKYRMEVDGEHIENMQKSFEFYVKLVDDNAVRLEKLVTLNQSLETEIQTLKKLVSDLTNKLSEYQVFQKQ